ncbi:MAG: biotin/lipoyl-containing protein [Eubacteriales bacterium]|nr:biotin/lipoyl-containing protein [Eubacteriales bacterium]
MRKFHVNVNGTSYEVEVEEIAAGAAPAAAPVQAAAPAAAAPAAAATVAAGATSVTAPMPGNILDIKVKVGDTVDANTVVIMLEAMKMENEIYAGVAGKVTAINVTKGSTVNSGDVLVVIG